MLTSNLELDRETYLAVAYPDGVPEPWTCEHEEQLPAIFRGAATGKFCQTKKGCRLSDVKPRVRKLSALRAL